MNEEVDNARIHKFTIYIVNSFMRSQLLERGYTWEPKDNNNDREFKEIREYIKITRIMETLHVLVKELRAFTRNNEHFPRIVSLLDDIHPEGAHDAFNTISDELFSDGIGWSHIVTLLVFGQELAINCIENRNDDMVDRIASWMSSYINLKLSEWIRNQGGWESVRRFASERPAPQNQNKSLKIFCGLAATVFMLGFTLLYSKLRKEL